MVDPDLGRRLSVRLDPIWLGRHSGLWSHPLGTQISPTYIDWESGVAEAAAPNYADTDIVGRGEMFKHWISTGNKDFSLTFKFRVQGRGSFALRQEVLYPARWLDKLKYPVYDSGAQLSYAPPPVMLTIGTFLQVRCVITDANIQWIEPFETDTLLPHGADVPVTFTVTRKLNDDMGYPRQAVTRGIWS